MTKMYFRQIKDDIFVENIYIYLLNVILDKGKPDGALACGQTKNRQETAQKKIENSIETKNK